MRHVLDVEQSQSLPFDLYIEEIEITHHRASSSDCLSSVSSFSCTAACTGSFSSVGSVASTGGGGCGGCHE